MSRTLITCRRVLIACCVLAATPLRAADGGADGEFIYHAQVHDTLIGLSRRLLIEPRKWPAVQTLNRIADPRRIPQGTALRIPYGWLKSSPETASVASFGGSVSRGGAPLSIGEKLPQGSQIETGADGSVTLDLADGSVITLQKSSVLTLDQMIRIDGVEAAHSTQLKLDAGRVEATVKPHRDVGRFEIITPVAVSAVRGTQFRDGYSGESAHALTETLQGAVSVGAGAAGAPVSVPAGFGTRVEQGHAPLPPVALLAPPDLSRTDTVLSGAEARLAWPAVPGAAGYRLQLADARDFHVLRADLQSDSPQVLLPALADGAYWVRVRSVDPQGLEGSDGLLQITRHRLPDAPLPVAPGDGAHVSGTAVPFAWSAADGAVHYRLQVATDAGFAQPLQDLAVTGGTTLACCDVPPGRYRWRLAALNAAGESGPWSDAREFVRMADAPQPDVPQIAGKRLRLGWQAMAGEHYHVQIARDARFTHLIYDGSSDEPQLNIARPFPYDYFARVQLIDADGFAGPYGPARAFTVPVPTWVQVVGHTVLLLPLIF